MRIDEDVLTVLSQCRAEGTTVFLPGEQLDRKLYQRVNAVLEAIGGKWNRKVKGHVFADDPGRRLDDAIVTGSVVRPKDEYGFFPTPQKVVTRLLTLAEIESGHRLLEPSAGHGAIADEMAKHAGTTLSCVELLPTNVEVLRANGHLVVQGDFLKWTGTFDRIVMNPPFARQQDIAHVTHAFGMLAPGGRVVSVMSAGVEFRQDRKATEFRDLVAANAGFIERLPPGSFKASGTDVNTVIAVIDRGVK